MPFRFRSHTALFPLLLLGAALLPLSCSSEPALVFADWLFPLPNGTAVLEYPELVDGSDPNAVTLVEDLVIGNDADDLEASLYRPAAVAAAADGTVYVADSGAHHIKVFSADGTWRRTLGEQGQGPGEFTGVRLLTIAGGSLVAYDTRNDRFSVWTLDGEHVADHKPATTRNVSSLYGLPDGTIIWTYRTFNSDRTTREVAVHTTLEGEELDLLFDRPGSTIREISLEDPLGMLQAMLDSLEDPRFVFAVGGDGIAYYSPAEAYQVLAVAQDGSSPRWAMRRAGAPPPFPDARKERLIEMVLDRFRIDADVGAEELTWPQRIPAIFRLRVDGAGRLFVFRAPAGMDLVPSESSPVDVYSADGEYLASGHVPAPWDYARGEHVFRITTDADDNPVVVRYRLLVNGK